MTKLVHRTTGVDMWVADERVEEFIAKGHSLPKTPKPVKKPARKTAKRKKGA